MSLNLNQILKFLFGFDPDKSFFGLPIVWLTIFAVLSGSLYSAYLIIENSYLPKDLSYAGFNSFLEIFKFSIGFLALLIPFLAVYAANHRSEQTKKNMLLLSEQNNFVNYYNHIKFFQEYLAPYKENQDLLIDEINYRQLHRQIFPKTNDGLPTYDVSWSFTGKLEQDISAFCLSLVGIEDSDTNKQRAAFEMGIANYYQLYAKYNCSRKADNDPSITVMLEDRQQIKLKIGDIRDLVIKAQTFISFIDRACSFSDTYHTSKMVSVFLKLDASKISMSGTLRDGITVPDFNPAKFFENCS